MALNSRGHDPVVDKHSSRLLTDLQDAHGTLYQVMAELGNLTHGPLPIKGDVVDARWKISRASLTRRSLWSRILSHLSTSAFSAHELDVRSLQETDMALLRLSSAHVARWSIDAVMTDWRGYGRASRDMREKMATAIQGEIRLLYPLLRGG